MKRGIPCHRGKPGRKCILSPISRASSSSRDRERKRERERVFVIEPRRIRDDNAIASSNNEFQRFFHRRRVKFVLPLSSSPRFFFFPSLFFLFFKPLRVSRTSLVRTKTGDPVYENYLIPPPIILFSQSTSFFSFLFFLLSYLPSYFSLVNLRTNSRAVSRLKGECRRMKLIRLNKGRGSKS